MTKPRWVAVVLAVLLVAGVVTAVVVWPRNAVAGSPVAAPGLRFDVPADRTSELPIDARWSIHIPAGGVRGPSTVTVKPVTGSVGPVGSTALAAAIVTLSSGQPAKPWTFTWHQDQPLAADEVLYLLDDTGDGAAYGVVPIGDSVAPATVRTAALSQDRRSGSVEVPHLSFLQWLSDAASVATNTLGTFFGQRSNPPACEAKRPAWLSDAVFVEDRNAPMLVCVGADPNKPDLAVVKVVNNRGGALLVTAPTAPDWAWQSVIGKEMESWAPNLLTFVVESLGVPHSESSRTWVLPPGQEVDLGFSRAKLDSSSAAEIVGSFTPSSIVFGLASKAVSELLDEQSRGWDVIVLGACLESLGARTIQDHSASGIAQGLASLARCVVEQPEPVIQIMRKLLPEATWQAVSGKVFHVANLAKKALTRYLALVEATFTLADVLTTMALPRSAFTISLFTKPEQGRTKVVTVVGVTRSGGPASGYTVTAPGDQVFSCGSSPASHDPGIVACAPSAASADICWVQPDRITLLCGQYPWAKELLKYTADQPITPDITSDYEVAPWGLELAGGLKCRLRNGGSWGGRADGYVGAYFCSDEHQYVLTTGGKPLLDKSTPQWTVKVGPLGADGDTFPPPKVVAVVTAYYAGMP